ncbi:MAG: 30S ribosomal protein S21 [Planctomycetota bacterium]
MIKVQVRSNEPLEAALRRFKRQCNYAGIFRLAKKSSVYEKPSEKRRREKRERLRNIQRQVRKAMQTKMRRRTVRRYSAPPRPEGDAGPQRSEAPAKAATAAAGATNE